MKSADIIKINVMCYWRFYRACPIVAIEHNYGYSDVLAVTRSGMIIETEVKVTLQDLKRDKEKPKHRLMQDIPEEQHGAIYGGYSRWRGPRCHYFYFAIPQSLESKALPIIKEMYPYAGVPAVRPNNFKQWDDHHHIVAPVYSVRQPHSFKRRALTESETMDIIRGLSATACRMAFDLLARDRL